MKHLAAAVMIVLFVLAGCANTNASEGVPYDSESLQTQLEDQSYQPKLPTQFPFEISEVKFSAAPTENEEKVFDFTFIGEGEAVELMTFNGESINLDVETEAVEIGSIEGQYAEQEVNDMGTTVRRLVWKEDGVVYNMSSADDQENDGASKEELIQIAESFE
ncbi:DUF4367 domain-containing protein [Halobacillus salinus]|uniref:DUF4367 domain-containing protein n=1 Tax=Halobacillus salinus TaxID=192814 RepID=UPI0009A57D5A|nr:DUF4367 domain-containing protein [Halobacillus salinus]